MTRVEKAIDVVCHVRQDQWIIVIEQFCLLQMLFAVCFGINFNIWIRWIDLEILSFKKCM